MHTRIQIATKIKSLHPLGHAQNLPKFHKNPFVTFSVIPLTNKQTDRRGNSITPFLVGIS